jgi:hypothetical protein
MGVKNIPADRGQVRTILTSYSLDQPGTAIRLPISLRDQMSDKEDLPVFPFEPTEMVRGTFRVKEYGDFDSEEEIQLLIQHLWLEPECRIDYYFEKDGPMDPLLDQARTRGDILMNKMKRRYYAHPNFKQDYVHIPDRDGEYAFDWESEVVEKGPEYWQVQLELSKRKIDELDAWRKVQLEEGFREQLRMEKYAYDVFLSYAAEDTKEAEQIHEKVEAAGGKIFMAPKVLVPGDDFAEEIRAALQGARELWLLLSPSSAKSEWVTSEWGAAWVLGRKIVPILHRCAPDQLPDRLRQLHAIDLYQIDGLISKAGFSKNDT